MTDWYKIKRVLIRVSGEEKQVRPVEPHMATQWPCPKWFHIPSKAEWERIVNTTVTAWWGSNQYAYQINFHLPMAWCRLNGSWAVNWQGSLMYYWTNQWWTQNIKTASSLIIQSSSTGVGNAWTSQWNSIRAFKDEFVAPDSSWTVIKWNTTNWICWNQSQWLISIRYNWTWYTMMDKNLWATTVFTYQDTLSQSNCWYYYQWWNNYWFPWTWALPSTSANMIDASAYWPTNYYESSTFIANSSWWDSSENKDLRWWVTWNVPVS